MQHPCIISNSFVLLSKDPQRHSSPCSSVRSILQRQEKLCLCHTTSQETCRNKDRKDRQQTKALYLQPKLKGRIFLHFHLFLRTCHTDISQVRCTNATRSLFPQLSGLMEISGKVGVMERGGNKGWVKRRDNWIFSLQTDTDRWRKHELNRHHSKGTTVIIQLYTTEC